MNKPVRRFFLIAALLTAMCFLFSWKSIEPLDRRKETINILYWTPMFQQLDFNLGLGSEIFKHCPCSNCYTTHHREYLPIEQYDAILFHGIEYNEETFGKPRNRTPNQIYIYSNQESPIYTTSFMKQYNGFYNWTMTHRLDSDIIRPYGFVEKRKTNWKPLTVEDVKNKRKLIAWMVSNCGTESQREMLYSKIARFLPVDVYGVCGNLTCLKERNEECYRMIEDNYKFYLSFENSICEDYVTEKLYNVLQRNIVPIVYGGANYKKIAPPNSVINVKDFKTVNDLVEFIKFLDAHPDEYLKYFEWKREFVVDTSNRLALCSLCQKLNGPIQTKVYSDIVGWWRGENLEKCPNAFNNINFF